MKALVVAFSKSFLREKCSLCFFRADDSNDDENNILYYKLKIFLIYLCGVPLTRSSDRKLSDDDIRKYRIIFASIIYIYNKIINTCGHVKFGV